MSDRALPSGKFGIWAKADGGAHLVIYSPDGRVAATVDFDRDAAHEFGDAVRAVIPAEATR